MLMGGAGFAHCDQAFGFVSGFASDFTSDLDGRRLRVKVAGLPGTMSTAPSHVAEPALLFFAGGASAGCFWSCANAPQGEANRSRAINIARETSGNLRFNINLTCEF